MLLFASEKTQSVDYNWTLCEVLRIEFIFVAIEDTYMDIDVD